jgi:hypothetical protein
VLRNAGNDKKPFLTVFAGKRSGDAVEKRFKKSFCGT